MGILLLDKFLIDDPVGAWPVHGLCGLWGGLATGLFGDFSDLETISSRGQFLAVQAIGSAAIIGWTLVTMAVVFGLIKAAGLLRVGAREEQEGLDVHEHGLRAYPDQWVASSDFSVSRAGAVSPTG